MARVKRGTTTHRKHKKILDMAKGYRGGRSTLIQQAKESLLHAGQYAFAGRKQRRRDMRQTWIIQVSNAVKQEGLSYSKFIAALKTNQVGLDRKVLAELAVNHPADFKKVVSEVAAPATPQP